MSTIFHDPIVKAIEIDLIDEDVVFVNWDNVKTIEVEFEAASEEKNFVYGEVKSKQDHSRLLSHILTVTMMIYSRVIRILVSPKVRFGER